MLREKIYELKNWKLAVHTTWNPGAENVMRIHLVPPRFLSGKIVPSVVILNGQEIVPVSEAWAILLTEFIRRINQYENHAIEEKEVQQVLKETFGAVRKIYPKTDPEVFHRDLSVMLDTFEDVIAGKIPQMEIAGISLGEYAPYMRAPHRMDLMVSAMTREGNGIAIKNAYTAMRQDNRCQKNRSLTLKAGKRSSVHAGKQELPN